MRAVAFNMNKQILLYGLALAVLAVGLSLIDYYYLVRAFPGELYIVLIALIFTGIGVWAGRKLTSSNKTSAEAFQQNEKALEYLGITERELEVLELLSEGYSNRQIADRLYLSIHTVKTHVSSLLGKLNAERRTQAIRKAKTLKLIP